MSNHPVKDEFVSCTWWPWHSESYSCQPPSTLQFRSSSKGSLAWLQERWFATPMNWVVTLGISYQKYARSFGFLSRKAVCSVLSQCIVCKTFHAKPVTQQMKPLPTSCMMAYQPPLSLSGKDLFSLLYVELGGSTVKRWCCLFMCLNTHAIHLELVHSMNLMIVCVLEDS